MRSITEAGDLKGKRALVRIDWNIPLNSGKVVNDFRIKQSLPTIEYLRKAGAKVILISHRDHPESTLEPMYEHTKAFLPELTFIQDGPLTLLENLRRNPGEMANAPEFAAELAKLGDIYVNEAFSESHRECASIVGVPKLLPSYAGLCFEREVQELSKSFYPKHPFLFILGGAKFDTKLPLLKKFVNIADDIFVGGALANNFFKEQGKDVGVSLVMEGDFGLSELMASGKIMLPEDSIIDGGRILDVGALSLEKLKEKIAAAKLVLWNGPLGNYELGYKVSTIETAKLIAELAEESIVGGGDTLAAIQELDILGKFSFVSTGGGAMLDFLAKGTLPGIEALK
jgi:phosphoglycerate kinase